MRLYSLLILSVVFFALSAAKKPELPANQTEIQRGERPPINLNNVHANAYEPGKIRIKLMPYMENLLPGNTLLAGATGFVTTNHPPLDALNQVYKVWQYKALFASLYNTRSLSSGFRDRHKEWGFHLWFELEMDPNADVISAVKQFAALVDVEIAEPEYKKQLLSVETGSGLFFKEDQSLRSPVWTPNDPRLNEQWHYNNTGQQGGTAGKDIKLFDAWEIEKGHSAVVVAVVDQGIQFNHPDLAANMWQNTFGDYGYNFVNSTTTISPGDHGTHVAGTVSAVNNNGIGVAGVAGGSGTGDGVRLMSCQVFTSSGSGGFHLAPVYAADNGAAISQNSWGYTSVGVYEQSALDAIDYFNINGGGTVLEGGITIFAAGNSYSSGAWYPGYYSGAFSVAATNNMDQRSWYSNYDTWIDISAPGGETNTVAERGVLSCLTSNSYGFYQGTSMACPHTSGVAALIVSLAYRNGVILTNADIKDILRNTTDNHYAQNPTYIGKLGTGRLNALTALQEVQGMLSGVLNPNSLTATTINSSQINLSWVKNTNNQDVMLVWSPDNSFGQPANGTVYTAGQTIPGGGSVLYRGADLTYSHTGLIPATQYFYKAFSFNAGNEYSPGRTTNSFTACEPTNSLPYIQEFTESGILPVCWDIVDNQGNGQVWQFGTITGYSPNPSLTGHYAYINSDAYGSGNSQNADLVSPLLDLGNYSNITLSFSHYFRSYSGSSATLSYSINGGTSWTAIQTWTATTSNPATFNQTITALNGQSQVKFKWNYTGTYGYYWAIDDVSITGMNTGTPVIFTTEAYATSTSTARVTGNVTSQGQSAVTMRGVCWSTSLNPTLADNYTVQGTGTGSFLSQLTGLDPTTTYYARAYATNDHGTSYGENKQFTTFCPDAYSLPFSEDFTGLVNIPNCWVSQNSASSPLFSWYVGSVTNGVTTTTPYAYVSNNTNNTTTARLMSPVFDFTGFTGITLALTHRLYFSANDAGTITLEYSLDGGVNWTTLNTYTTTFAQVNYSNTIAAIANQSNVRFRWNMTKGANTRTCTYSFDNLSVTGTSVLFANFNANMVNGFVGMPITFSDASGNGAITTWSWNFGEGASPATANTQGPHEVSYSTAGFKNVSLTVNGSVTNTKTGFLGITENAITPPRSLSGNLENLNKGSLTWTPPKLNDSYEHYNDFNLRFGSYTQYDLDGSITYGIQNTNFPNMSYTGSFIVFNPYKTSPPLASTWTPFTGRKMLACFASTTPPNNDWLITPQLRILTGESFSFYARSITDAYGLERLRIGISVSGNQTGDFTIISTGSYLEIPITWTKYTFDLSAYANQDVYISLNCVSDDAFALLIDDLKIESPGDQIVMPSQHNPFQGIAVNEVKLKETNPAFHSLTFRENTRNTSPAFTYRITRNNAFIAETNMLSFDENVLPPGDHLYEVTAIYVDPAFESPPSNEVVITVNHYTWTGNESSAWNTPENWINNEVPPETLGVIVPSEVLYFPVISSEATECNNLIIREEARVTISPTGQLTVNGTLLNEAGVSGLILQSDLTGTASLIHTDPAVPATIERYFDTTSETRHPVASPSKAVKMDSHTMPGKTDSLRLRLMHRKSKPE